MKKFLFFEQQTVQQMNITNIWSCQQLGIYFLYHFFLLSLVFLSLPSWPTHWWTSPTTRRLGRKFWRLCLQLRFFFYRIVQVEIFFLENGENWGEVGEGAEEKGDNDDDDDVDGDDKCFDDGTLFVCN